MSFTVVFDSNVFSEEEFPRLKSSMFFKLMKRRRIEAIYGDVFIQEVVNCYLVNRLRPHLLNEWLPFLWDSNGKFARSLFEIRREELVGGRGLRTRIFLNPTELGIIRRNLMGLSADGSSAGYIRTKEEKAQYEKERTGFKAISLLSRKNFQDAIAKKPHLKAVRPTFLEVLPAQVDKMAEALLPVLLDIKHPISALDSWRRRKANYPYVTNTITSHVFAQYFAMTDVSPKLDLNAQADLDLMLHLANADILVSNETGYIKRAFESIWKPVGKKLVSTTEFYELIRSW